MRTCSVLSEPSTSGSSLVSRQTLSCSPRAAHLRTEGEIGHFADHAPEAGRLSEHNTGIRAGVCTVIGGVIFGSNSPSCARLSLSSPDVNVFIRCRTRILHLCSGSWWWSSRWLGREQKLLHGGFKVCEVRQWYVRTTKFGLCLIAQTDCSQCKFWTATCGTNLRLCVRLQGCENYGDSGQSMYESTILWGESMRSFSLLDGNKLQQHRKCESIPCETYWSISSRRKGTWIGIKWYCKRTCFTGHMTHGLQLARQILGTATALDTVQVNITFASGGVATAGDVELILVAIGAKSERGEHWKCIGEASSAGKTWDHSPPRRTARGITQIPW